ncbi:response regulator [Phenylobacterium montanum]|uniref:histidine kinase n=1 Tax=Phenylobacterium montanum TaxID=2823693 RepID=A0A975G517_9CAUL|nr:response regulator [Caulobacter sp. S6]
MSRRFLIGVGLTALVVTVLGSVGAFAVFQHELSARQLSFLSDYVRERSSNVDKRFTTLSGLQHEAARELGQRVGRLSLAELDRLIETYYPRFGDGTRRSPAPLFDGSMNAAGEYTYGMGAYLGHPDAMTDDERRAMAAAFELVSDFGRAAHDTYDNFYFFTPGTRLVVFGPDRPDRLMFYRHDAPPNLDVSHEQMATLTSPAEDPDQLTRCTTLQRLIQDTHGERLASACLTPVYLHGRYVGSFGSSIDLSGFFRDAVKNGLPGATSLVVMDDGQVIASPRFASEGAASPEEVAAYEKALKLKAIAAAIHRDGRKTGVITSPDGGQIVAYGRLSGPNWYLLEIYPKSAVTTSAAWSASWVLLIGLIAAAFQTLLVVRQARMAIVGPLETLAASSAASDAADRDRPEVRAVERRQDEIGVLARALREERGKVEAVLASLEERVRERTSALERANAEKSRFLANMSHELRTPLNGVIAISETLAKSQRTLRDRELAELIVSSGRLLEQVLTDILDFSKIEAGEIALAEEVFSLDDVVARIAELHRAAAEAKGLDFRWSVDPGVSGYYGGDSVRLTQVLSNLLSNAVKFTERGSVALSVAACGEGLRFLVADTGIGFDESVRARLFRRFEQADTSIRRRFGGTGLGLAISRSLAELMGGRIDVVSAPGEGSTFEVVLPLARSLPAPVETDEAAEEEVSLAGRRILLAEDHPTNQKVIQVVLDMFGVDLVIVENGLQAMRRLESQRFDLVLMDMQMPEMDGLSATEALRALERETGQPRTPVIMLTANALDEHVRASLAAGADEHLSKPIRAEALIEAIARAVSGQAHHAVAAAG